METRKRKPTQLEIVLRSLVEAGERGLSSYRAYDPNFPVKRLPARIKDLKYRGCKIESWGGKEKHYILREVPLEVAMTRDRDPKRGPHFYKLIPGLMAYVKFERITAKERGLAIEAGKIKPVFDDKENRVEFIRV